MSDLTSSGSEEQDQFSSVLLLGTNCPFAKLPIELQFKCLNYASPSTIFRLGLTNQFFRSLVTSSEICKSRVKRLWESYGDGKSDERIFETVDGNEQYEDWDEVWSFLVSHEHYLGWWAATEAPRGKLMRVALGIRPTNPKSPRSVLNRFVIYAAYLSARNNVERVTANIRIPQGAIWTETAGSTSYELPLRHHSPDSGLEVDFFEPYYQFTPFFAIDPILKAKLIFEYWNVKVAIYPDAYSASISLNFQKEYRTEDNTFRVGEDAFTYNSLFRRRQLHRFPTRKVLNSGTLRPPFGEFSDLVSLPVAQADVICTSAFFWSLNTDSLAKAECDSPPLSPAPTPVSWANFIYQSTATAVHPQTTLPWGSPAYISSAGNGLPRLVQSAMTTNSRGQMMNRVENNVPIHSPLSTFQAHHRLSVESHNVKAADLQGLWVGTYGPHGCEFGYISVRRERLPPNEPFDSALELEDEPLEDVLDSLASNVPHRRIVEYVKMTGDANVPSGQISWQAFLEDDPVYDNLPTVTNENWLDWSDTPHQLLNPSVWGMGTRRARGRVALQGYVQSRWSIAESLFIRTEGTGAVDEIRLRWLELGKVAVFKRVVL